MKKLTAYAFVVVFTSLALTGLATAATKTVTLAVKNMTCPVCPITVKKALNRVAGVSDTNVSYERKEAVVTYDDTQTDVAALIEATTNAGYPSVVKR